MEMASAVTTSPAISNLSSNCGIAVISLLFSRHASVINVIPALNKYAGTISGLRPFCSKVPRIAFPSTHIISRPLMSSLRKASMKSVILSAIQSESMPFSTRQSVGSEGTPFIRRPILRNRVRLCLPNSTIPARPTHFDARASTIRISMSSRR